MLKFSCPSAEILVWIRNVDSCGDPKKRSATLVVPMSVLPSGACQRVARTNECFYWSRPEGVMSCFVDVGLPRYVSNLGQT